METTHLAQALSPDQLDRATLHELNAAPPNVLAAPKDHAAVETLCRRPDHNQRGFPESLALTVAGGNEGCAKWKVRMGRPACDRTSAPEYEPLRLRGVYFWTVCDGKVRLGDTIAKLC